VGDKSFKKKKYIIKRDVYLPWELFASDAFKTLSAKAIQVLLKFLQKRTWSDVGKGKQRRRVFNNSGLVFTYAEANEMRISTSQFHDIITKLVEVGFIDIEHQGGGLARDCSRYTFSDRWKDYGTDAFKSVDKKRVLWAGHDVRSNMKRKNKATGNRSCQLRETVVIGPGELYQGA